MLKKWFSLSVLVAGVALVSMQDGRAEDSRVVARIRVLHHNIYGRDKAQCSERYKALARHILEANPPYDIVTLNEHWDTSLGDLVGETCNSDILTEALMTDPRYRSTFFDLRSRLSYPHGSTLQLNGGNSILTTHKITDHDAWVFSNSNNIPVAGFMRTEIELAPGVSLDFWTTHFESGSDGCGEKCHHTEVRQLGNAVIQHSGWYNKNGVNGHPVLIAGDFNMGGPISVAEREQHYEDPAGRPYNGNPGYDYLMTYFHNPRDLWLETHPVQDDPNEGYSYDIATNPLAYDSGRERIDLLLNPTDPLFQRSPFSVRPVDMHIVRWKTVGGVPVSDHYGLDATLEIVRDVELPSAP